MNFRNLPKNIQDGVRELTKDEEFQYRFGHDKILDELDEMETNKNEEYTSLMLLLKNEIVIEDKIYHPLTIAIWGFLYVIDSPFINSEKEVTELDIDIFFYLLDNGVAHININDTIINAAGYSKKLNLDINNALDVILKIIKISFQPLNLFPKKNSNGKNLFDGDWVTALVTKVYNVTGYDANYIMNTLSLHACCYYFAQYARENGAEQIFRRTPEEIMKLKDKRASELVVERLIEKGVMPKEERDKWYNEIITPPKKNK